MSRRSNCWDNAVAESFSVNPADLSVLLCSHFDPLLAIMRPCVAE